MPGSSARAPDLSFWDTRLSTSMSTNPGTFEGSGSFPPIEARSRWRTQMPRSLGALAGAVVWFLIPRGMLRDSIKLSAHRADVLALSTVHPFQPRSEERRVGKEC